MTCVNESTTTSTSNGDITRHFPIGSLMQRTGLETILLHIDTSTAFRFSTHDLLYELFWASCKVLPLQRKPKKRNERRIKRSLPIEPRNHPGEGVREGFSPAGGRLSDHDQGFEEGFDRNSSPLDEVNSCYTWLLPYRGQTRPAHICIVSSVDWKGRAKVPRYVLPGAYLQ